MPYSSLLETALGPADASYDMLISGGYIYVATTGGMAKVYKLNQNTFAIEATWESTGHSPAYATHMCTDGTNLYVFWYSDEYTSVAKITKIVMSTMTTVVEIASNLPIQTISLSYLDGFLYEYIIPSMNQLYLWKRQVSDLAVTAYYDYSTTYRGVGNTTRHLLVNDGTYLYMSASTGTPNYDLQVLQINPTTGAVVQAWTGASSFAYNGCLTIGDTGELYIADGGTNQMSDPPFTVYKLDTSDMTTSDSYEIPSGYGRANDIFYSGGWLEAVCFDSDSIHLLELDTEDMSLLNTWVGNDSEQFYYGYARGVVVNANGQPVISATNSYLLLLGAAVIYPKISTNRVNRIRHIYMPGVYKMEFNIGGVAGITGDYAKIGPEVIESIEQAITEGKAPEVPTVTPPTPSPLTSTPYATVETTFDQMAEYPKGFSGATASETYKNFAAAFPKPAQQLIQIRGEEIVNQIWTLWSEANSSGISMSRRVVLLQQIAALKRQLPTTTIGKWFLPKGI